MKRIFFAILVVFFVVAIIATPSAVLADDCKGNSCQLTPTPQVMVTPHGEETKSCWEEDVYVCRWSGPFYFEDRNEPSYRPNPDWVPQPFHKRDCLRTLSCFNTTKKGE